jgi:hypothetical protein
MKKTACEGYEPSYPGILMMALQQFVALNAPVHGSVPEGPLSELVLQEAVGGS